MVRGIISGRQSMTQIVGQLVDNLAEKEISSTLEVLTEKLAADAGIVASTDTSSRETLLIKAAEWLATKSLFSEQVLADAGRAAAGVYASTADIPVVGPFLAPVLAGAAFAAVAAFDSFETGTSYVPRTGPALIMKASGLSRVQTTTRSRRL